MSKDLTMRREPGENGCDFFFGALGSNRGGRKRQVPPELR
jgi:hypothetical protein